MENSYGSSAPHSSTPVFKNTEFWLALLKKLVDGRTIFSRLQALWKQSYIQLASSLTQNHYAGNHPMNTLWEVTVESRKLLPLLLLPFPL